MNYEISQALADYFNLYLIKWGRSQLGLPLFVLSAFFQALSILGTDKSIQVIILGDGVLSPLGMILKILTKRKILVMLHGLDLSYPSFWYQSLCVPCLKQLDSFIYNSKITQEIALAKGLPTDSGKVVPLGVNPKKFTLIEKQIAREEVGKEIGISLKDRFILLYVGRLVKRKGMEWFLENCWDRLTNRIPEAVLLIVGSGPEKKKLESIISKKGISGRVLLLGRIADQQLNRIYSAADLFIMPNITVEDDVEGFGLVALEAGINELCPVCSNLQGITEAVTDRVNGILVEPEDEQQFCDAIVDLYLDRAKLTDLGKKARSYCMEAYSWEKVASNYFKAITDLMSLSA